MAVLVGGTGGDVMYGFGVLVGMSGLSVGVGGRSVAVGGTTVGTFVLVAGISVGVYVGGTDVGHAIGVGGLVGVSATGCGWQCGFFSSAFPGLPPHTIVAACVGNGSHDLPLQSF